MNNINWLLSVCPECRVVASVVGDGRWACRKPADTKMCGGDHGRQNCKRHPAIPKCPRGLMRMQAIINLPSCRLNKLQIGSIESISVALKRAFGAGPHTSTQNP